MRRGYWKRDYGDPYPGTKEETPDTDNGSTSGLLRQSSTLPGNLPNVREVGYLNIFVSYMS